MDNFAPGKWKLFSGENFMKIHKFFMKIDEF